MIYLIKQVKQRLLSRDPKVVSSTLTEDSKLSFLLLLRCFDAVEILDLFA